MLQNIRIVLVETSHTGNMGSTARAMKTMGLSNLYLVNPLMRPDLQAVTLASGASDIIDSAKVVATLEDAIKDCSLVLGASARSRALEWPMLEPRACGVRAIQESEHAPVALLFGRERAGLTNNELQKCHYHVAIPSNPDYTSLNLAMAVQILAYDLRLAYLDYQKTRVEPPQEEVIYPLSEDLEHFYQHLEQILKRTNFIRTARSGRVMSRLRRLFNRARPEAREINILRGILASIEKHSNYSIK